MNLAYEFTSEARSERASVFFTRGTSGRSPRTRGGFTMLEMLTTVAVLIIVLGLMVSLARRVRRVSADQATRDLLLRLDLAMDEYVHLSGDKIPDVTPLRTGPDQTDEGELLRRARLNNEQFVRMLKSRRDLSDRVFGDLSLSYYDEVNLRDAWGTPIVFMPRMDPDIGMGPKDYFFFSAGPDRKFLTRDDNLYSYEQIEPGR